MTTSTSLALSLLSTVAIAACDAPAAGTDAGTTNSVAAPAVPDETVFDEIAVIVSPDGTLRTTSGTITAGVERAQAAARARGGVEPLEDQDPTCLGASFWLYDRADQTGNRICFSGRGGVALASFLDLECSNHWCFRGNWQLSSGSYYAGTESGYLQENVSPSGGGGGGGFHQPDAGAVEIQFGPYGHASFSIAPAYTEVLVLTD
jgi:hypothetical protein